MYPKLYKAGYFAYLLLFILAAFFYKERTIFIDAAYHLFYIIKDNGFAIQHGRYGAAVTQIFPLFFRKVQASLDGTMFIYSTGFILYYFICYFLCGQVLKQYALALCLLLFNILFVSDTFYWIPSELPQGIACMFVMLSVFRTEYIPNKYIQYTVGVVLIIFTAFFHPLLWLAAAFTIIFLLLSSNNFSDKRLFIIGSICFIVLSIVKQKFFPAGYDAYAIKQSDKIWDTFPYWIDLPSNKEFLKLCMSTLLWIPVSSLIISIIYLAQKKWLKLTLFICSMAGYILLVNATYSDDTTPTFYIENLYLPLGIFLALPIVFDVFPYINKHKLALPLLLLIITTGIVRIYATSNTYTTRLKWERSYLEEHRGQKLLIAKDKVPQDTLIMTWGTPYEFWLLSTTEKDTTENILVANKIEELMYARWDRKSFITNWGVMDYGALPYQYFIFTDTFSRFEVVR